LQPPINCRPPDSTTFDSQISRPEQSAIMEDARAENDVAPEKADIEEKVQATPAKQRREAAHTHSDDGEIAPGTPERAMTPRAIIAAPTPTGEKPDQEPPLTQAGGAEPQEDTESQN
jgi:hypothetical protein